VTLADIELISRRASENLHFFTLRDSTSSIQLVSRDKALSEELMSAPLESVIQIEGGVKGRKAKSKSSSSVSNNVSPGRGY
jgi:aspartyl-tRNA synthetase